MCKKSLAGWQIIYKYIKKVYIPMVLVDFGSATSSQISATAATWLKKNA